MAISKSSSPAPSTIAAEAAEQQLRRSAYRSLHDIRCTMDAGTVVLRGCVPSFFMKQLAQEAVRKTEGVRAVVNELEVDV